MKKITLLKANLMMFDGEGSGDGAADAGQQMGEASAEAQSDASSEDRTETFKNMIRGEYKDLYDAEVQKIVKSRLKDMSELQNRLNGQQEIIDRMNAKYGIKDNDLQALGDAIDHDEALWEAAADEAGMTTEQFIQFQNLERQNSQLLRAEQERVRQQETQAQVSAWMQEASAIQEQFPEFDNYDDEFVENEEQWTETVAQYVDDHLDRFATILE